MRLLTPLLALVVLALPVRADDTVNRLVDAMGVPLLIQAFVQDGFENARLVDEAFLAGQGGDVFYETVRKIYASDRLESEMRQSLNEGVKPETASKALVFFESELGQKIVDLEVQARQAMVDNALEASAKSAADNAQNSVLRLLTTRDLIGRNVEIAMAAQYAFYEGLEMASQQPENTPDIESQRDILFKETSAWITGYYVLVASALSDKDLNTYVAFWETEVGAALDKAMNDAFQASMVTLSFGLGQTVGRLLPQNEL